MSQNSKIYKGIYAIYETVNYETQLKQWIPSSKFRENYQSLISSYPSIKFGYSYTALSNLGLSNLSLCGVDFGVGLSYSKSIMNGYTDSSVYYWDPLFLVAPTNDQTFFNYYQPGNRCSISDYGVNMHFDVGTVFYAGAELDAGPSRIIFTDNRIQGQEVRSTGWYVNTLIKAGVSIPLSIKSQYLLRPLDLNSRFKLNIKLYGIFNSWSGRFYKLDWVSEDKKLKNFSILDIEGKPSWEFAGCGISLTFLFENKSNKQNFR